MNPFPAEPLDGRLKPSSHERKFEEFLKQHELHFTQSECGLGWVERNYSNSGIYSHSVGLDVANEAIRQALPAAMGYRSLFRFMIPAIKSKPPHLTISDQQLAIPNLDVRLPKNPDLHHDVAGFLLMAKGQALREFAALEMEPSVSQITALMAIWYGWSWPYGNPYGNLKDHSQGVPTPMIQWLSGVVPPYLCVVKCVWPKRFKDITLEDAIQAKGISARRLAILYPAQENES